jgi:hypothetical protein
MAKRKKLKDQNPPRRVEIRGQDHLLAYITPEEAQLLMDNGGSGEPGPMGIPAFDMNEGQTDDFAGNPDSAAGAGTNSLGDVIGGYLSSGPIGIIGGFLDSAVGLEAHAPGAGGGTGGDGFPETSYMSRYYGGGGSSENRCPEGYIYDEQLAACRLNTRPDDAAQQDGGLLQPATSGGYARMGLLDVSPESLSKFVERYGISGFDSPNAFEQQNLAFRRQSATYPEFYKQPPLMPGYTNLETGAVVPPSGVPVAPAPAPVPAPVAPAPAPVAPAPAPVAIEATPYGRIDALYTDAGEITPTYGMVRDIMSLGINDPLIQRAQETLGPSAGDPLARALDIASQMPTPELGLATRGQYLESLGEIARATGLIGNKIQDDSGRTIGYKGFERPEGDN